jgi:hypothetical protein
MGHKLTGRKHNTLNVGALECSTGYGNHAAFAIFAFADHENSSLVKRNCSQLAPRLFCGGSLARDATKNYALQDVASALIMPAV